MSLAWSDSATRAGIALGSNLGDRLWNLRQARDQICKLNGTILPIQQSAVYETTPVDCEKGAPNFYNAVIEIGFKNSAKLLLQRLQEIERSLGRGGSHERNVSRTIDLDLLYFGQQTRGDAELQLPHPRMKEREFVLRPLADIVPQLRLPGEAASVRELLGQMAADGLVTCATQTW